MCIYIYGGLTISLLRLLNIYIYIYVYIYGTHKGPARYHNNYNKDLGFGVWVWRVQLPGHSATMLPVSISTYCCLRSSRATASDLRVRTVNAKTQMPPKNPNYISLTSII